MDHTPSTTLLQETIEMFQNMRLGVMKAMKLLYETKQAGVWTDTADTWGEFVEQDLKISQGYASKLLSTWEHYAVNGGMRLEQLAGVDYEKLYAARSLPGSTEEQVAMAKTLTRREIKETKNESEEHVHEVEYVAICKNCNMRLYGTEIPETGKVPA